PSLCHGVMTSVSSQISAPSLRSLTHPRVMKQILLRVAPMVAEVFLCERLEPRRVQSWRPGKISFPEHPLDPDIDREGTKTLVGKEHHTISNLRAHARQLAQTHPKIEIGQLREFLKIDTADRDQTRRCQQIFVTITKRALAQFLF